MRTLIPEHGILSTETKTPNFVDLFHLQITCPPEFPVELGLPRPTGFWAKWPVGGKYGKSMFQGPKCGKNHVPGSKTWKHLASSYRSVVILTEEG